MQMTLIDYSKPRSVDVKSFCESAGKLWRDLPDETRSPVLVIGCTASSAEEIVPYLDEYYPEIVYGISIIPQEGLLVGDVELKDGDMVLARQAIESSKSAMWAVQTVIRHGVPKLRAEKAVRQAFAELAEKGA